MATPRGHILPSSKEELDRLAERLIVASGVAEVLPTPLEHIAAVQDLELISDYSAVQEYLHQLKSGTRRIFRSAVEKLRGAADLRERVIFVPDETNQSSGRKRFAAGHEIAHQCIEWHNVSFDGFLDDDYSLSPEMAEEFENEANYLGALLNFQGERFIAKTRSVRPTISAIHQFANMHDMSFQATAWQFIEASDEIVSLGFYYPCNESAGLDSLYFKLWKVVCSPRFQNKFGAEALPITLDRTDRLVSLSTEQSTDDYETLLIRLGAEQLKVQVQSYWNRYLLTVLVRRPPRLAAWKTSAK